MTRDELIWKMAKAAWEHHYCPSGARKQFCEQCQRDRSSAGEVECFELSGGFKCGDGNYEWRSAAEGALEVLEAAIGIDVLPKRNAC